MRAKIQKLEVSRLNTLFTDLKVQIPALPLKIFQAIALILLVLLALWPAGNISYIVGSTGANNISNDYLGYISTIDRVLQGNYNWLNFFRDTFQGSHSLALGFFTEILIAKFASWDMYVDLFLGIGLAGLRVLLLYSAFTCLEKRPSRWVVLPLVSALVFSTSQITVFTFGQISIVFELSLFGFALGIWAVTRFRGHWYGVGLLALGGVIASWTGAQGLITWPIFLGGMILLGYRKILDYVIWVVGLGLGTWPYVMYLLIDRVQGARSEVANQFDLSYVVSALGWPLSKDFGGLFDFKKNEMASTAGWFGIALGVAGLVLLLTRWKLTIFRQVTPALMVMLFGLVTTVQIGLFRGAVLPWYTTPFICYWIGLVGLAYVLWINRQSGLKFGFIGPFFKQAIALAGPIWSIIFIVILAWLYLRSNTTYEDKSYYLVSRTPASAACLRQYRIAPGYCERTIFQWDAANMQNVVALAEPLERHHINVFAPKQQWTLQGNFIFDSVQVSQPPGAPDLLWLQPDKGTPAAWSSYKHLNLLLKPPTSLSWTVALPANLVQAEFHSAVGLGQGLPSNPGAGSNLKFEIWLEQAGQAPKVAYSQQLSASEKDWKPFSFSLSEYAGKTVTLHFTTTALDNAKNAWALYRYPYIDLEVDYNKPDNLPKTLPVVAPPPSTADLQIDLKDTKSWQFYGMTAVANDPSGLPTWTLAKSPYLKNAAPLNLCLADYSHLYVKAAINSTTGNTPMQVELYFEGYYHTAPILLLNDGQLHEYTYDLKLLQGSQSSRVSALRIKPLLVAASSRTDLVQFADLRLLRKPGPSVCG
jgi:hypothetical protein